MKLIATCCLLFIWTGLIGQFNPTGKHFKGIIHESCKERINGGCWIVDYCVLSFQQDSVLVHYDIVAYCTPEDTSLNRYDINPKRFEWRQSNDTIHIQGFDTYGLYLIRGADLVGSVLKNKMPHQLPFSLVESEK